MRVALISLDQRWEDKDANFERCMNFSQEARVHGCDLIVFPEMTLTGYTLNMGRVSEPEATALTLRRFGKLAEETGLSIVFGACLLNPASERPRNQFCLARPDGTSRAIYAKMHPFSFAGEHNVLDAGNRLGSASVGTLKLGASICYDLRFPELYAAMAPSCNAAIVIANWPSKRVAHWRTLLAARAIENQFYMLGVNRTGVDGNGLIYEKSTLALAPDGNILKPVLAGQELDIYDFDPAETARYRDEFPTLRDKRYSLYREFTGDAGTE
ncbi:MAG: nitrilase-related carbon-nitrogen hydrolase [Gallionella sp.]|nr:nitrilase-related carbon-nitrogen hydrolase [Gallionella sp.]